MPDDIRILGNIYVLVSVICYIYVITTMVKVAVWAFHKKQDATQVAKKEFSQDLEFLFDKNKIEKLHQVVDKKLISEENSSIALFWKVRALYLNGRSKEAEVMAERLLKVDPSFRQFLDNFDFQK